MDEQIKQLSDFIEINAQKNAANFPIDRYYLEPFVDRIKSFDRNDFILYNLEGTNNLYSEHLMLCLPELWENISIDDLIKIIRRFTNEFSFFGFINFTYKFVEINIIEIILLMPDVKKEYKQKILDYYCNTQYPNLLKTNVDFLFFEQGLFGVTMEDWSYIKQKMLLDERVKPALKSITKLEQYFQNLFHTYKIDS